MIILLGLIVIGIILFLTRDKWLRKLRKAQKEYFIAVEPEEYGKKLSIAEKREGARLQSKVNRLTEENKKLKELIEEFKKREEERVPREAIAQAKQVRRIKRKKRFKIMFKSKPVRLVSVDRHLPFRDKTGKAHKYWRGIELEDTREGPKFNFILSNTTGRMGSKKIGRVGGILLPNFPLMFTNLNSLTQDLKSGRCVVNILPDGSFISPIISPESKTPKSKTTESKTTKGDPKFDQDIKRLQMIDIGKILETKDPEVIRVVTTLYKKLQRSLSEKRQAIESEKEAIMDKVDAQIAYETTSKALDRATSYLGVALNKIDVAYDKLTEAKINEQSSRLKEALTEMVSRKLWVAIDNTLTRMERVGIPEREAIRESIEKEMDFATRKIVESLLTAQGMMPTKVKAKE